MSSHQHVLTSSGAGHGRVLRLKCGPAQIRWVADHPCTSRQRPRHPGLHAVPWVRHSSGVLGSRLWVFYTESHHLLLSTTSLGWVSVSLHHGSCSGMGPFDSAGHTGRDEAHGPGGRQAAPPWMGAGCRGEGLCVVIPPSCPAAWEALCLRRGDFTPTLASLPWPHVGGPGQEVRGLDHVWSPTR